VLLPSQFFSQTKKAAATEGTQTASSIAKQAAAYYLEQGSLGTVDKTCATYAGDKINKIKKAKFKYSCDGTAGAFVVTATGDDKDANTKDVIVTFTGDLTEGTFDKPVIKGL
jgi:hypothetical protein